MILPSPADLALNSSLPDAKAKALLASVGFLDCRAALRCLKRIANESQAVRQSLANLLPHLFEALDGCADPDHALVNLERFVSVTDTQEILDTLVENPRVLDILITLFVGSQYLTEILLREPSYYELLLHRERLAQPKSARQYFGEALNAITSFTAPPQQLVSMRLYQRGELLRIGVSDLLDLYNLPTVISQLSNLADGMICVCLAFAAAQTGIDPRGFVVLAVGKLGGQELNYSSDIDLLFLSSANAGSYLRLGQHLIEALSSVTAEGFLYRVDMRLRPWGRGGALISSLDGFLGYLARHARLWEKQALLKARPVAGDIALGEEFLRHAEPLIFGSNVEIVRTSVHAMKQRTEEVLHQQGRNWGEVKLGEGSIRDVEFVVQFLQLAHGTTHPEIRGRSTLDALPRLAAADLLSPDETRILTDGYVFLRTIEHYLQMMHYRQTNTLPSEPAAIALLARRLGFQTTEQFLTRYQQHGTAIRAVYMRHVGNETILPQPPSEVRQHIARMEAAYVITFSEADIQHHAALADQLDENRLAVVDAKSLEDGRWRVTIVGYDYPGELSIICGLMIVYGLNINDGEVFTYEPIQPSASTGRLVSGRPQPPQVEDVRRKIVDVFTVSFVHPEPPTPKMWLRYADELVTLLKKMRSGQRREARGELITRVCSVFQDMSESITPLYPVDIVINNKISERYTVLRIDAPDTVGFLYEFTNALALNRVYIARVMVQSVGERVHDVLFVTDEQGRKITSPKKKRELRAATVLIKHFTHLLPHSPNPETALLHFHEFLGQLFQRPNWPDELATIERSDVLHALAHVLGVSDFLWDDFLRMQYANLFPVVSDVDALGTARSRTQLKAELESVLTESGNWHAILNAFKDREMLRIDMRHILGHTTEFWQFSEELTNLAEVVVNSAYHLSYEDLRRLFGTPTLENGHISQMCVCALGKFGGQELGFASDIELMFIYDGNGQTTGPQVVTNAEFYEKVVQNNISAIHSKREGIFEVDLRLRPYGDASSLAVSLDAFKRYFALNGPAWAYERQALVKMRPVAGDSDLGNLVISLRDEFVYSGESFDVTAMRAMRERQIQHLVTGGTFNAKYSPGGLLDVEYLVQGLQIKNGHGNPTLHLTNTREAMAALADCRILSPIDFTRLRKAHTFLRWIIDSLRVVRGNAKDVTVPPKDSEEFAFLARRLRYGKDISRLHEELNRYTSDVQELNNKLLG